MDNTYHTPCVNQGEMSTGSTPHMDTYTNQDKDMQERIDHALEHFNEYCTMHDTDFKKRNKMAKKELSTLIASEKEKYLEDFVQYAFKKGYKVKGVGMSIEEITVEIDFKELIEQYNLSKEQV